MPTRPTTTASPICSTGERSTTTSPAFWRRTTTTFAARSCCWTSTASRRSTIASATRRATWSCSASPNNSRRSAPEAAVVARLGGDEFAVLIPDVGSDASTMAIVEQLRIELTRPIVVDGFPLSVGVSIGLAFAPTHGRTPEDLLSAADVAMYRAKRYRTGVESYKALGSRPERGRLGLLGELSNAIACRPVEDPLPAADPLP